MPEHVHVAVSIPPRISIAEMVQKLKGSSSHLLNHGALRREFDTFAWQSEYGAISFGERSLDRITAYVKHQAEHHAADTLWPSFELTERPYPSKDGESRAETVSPGVETPGSTDEALPGLSTTIGVHSPGRASSVQRGVSNPANKPRETGLPTRPSTPTNSE
jgi:hypothetical protein